MSAGGGAASPFAPQLFAALPPPVKEGAAYAVDTRRQVAYAFGGLRRFSSGASHL